MSVFKSLKILHTKDFEQLEVLHLKYNSRAAMESIRQLKIKRTQALFHDIYMIFIF